MIIALSPISSADLTLDLARSGDTLTINGDELDLTVLPDGAEISHEDARGLHPMIAGPIKRIDGDIHITLLLPYAGGNDDCVCFPDPMDITEDGPVDLPFASYSETEQIKVEGGTNFVTTTYRWRQEPEVSTEFVPDPPPQGPEPEPEADEGDDNDQD